MKRVSILVGGLLVALLAALLMIARAGGPQHPDGGGPGAGRGERRAGDTEASGREGPGGAFRLCQLVEFNRSEHPAARRSSYYAKYVTPSSSLTLETPDGRMLYAATPESPFVGIAAVEGARHVMIDRGDGRHRVVETTTLEAIDLPVRPPVERPIGFCWRWLDEGTAIGVGGVGYAESARPKAECCDEHLVAESLVYVYRISGGEFEPVDLPRAVQGRVFGIGAITGDGCIELVSESGHDDDGESLGWFKVEPR